MENNKYWNSEEILIIKFKLQGDPRQSSIVIEQNYETLPQVLPV